MTTPIDTLKSVLCDPDGRVSIPGSPRDLALIQDALNALSQPQVIVTAYSWKSGKRVADYTYRALFHGFSTQAMEYEGGFCPDAVAIVEDIATGRCDLVSPNSIMFVRADE